MTSNYDENRLSELLNKPLWQMNGDESCFLMANTSDYKKQTQQKEIVKGNQALSEALGCGMTKIYQLRHLGILDGAVLSSVGRMTIYDVEKARELAEAYMQALNSSKEGVADEG